MGYTFDYSVVFDAWQALLNGAWLSVRLAAIAMSIGLALPVVLAVGKLSGPRPVRLLIDAYIEVVRNTPLLVQVFFVYFGLPAVGIRLPPDTAALVALVVNAAAYTTEIIRAGIESINKGQIEAGLAIGLHRLQVLRYVVMRPAMKVVFPAVTSQFNVVTAQHQHRLGDRRQRVDPRGGVPNSLTFRSFEIYTVVAVMYFIMSALFSLLFAGIYRLLFSYPDAH